MLIAPILGLQITVCDSIFADANPLDIALLIFFKSDLFDANGNSRNAHHGNQAQTC